jgi:hypothetical protein
MRERWGAMRAFLPSLSCGVALAIAACGSPPAASAPSAPSASPARAPAAAELRPPEAFASISDRDARSRALFLEASRVLFHPRCVSCHPSDDSPRQRDATALHDPPVTRGDDDRGVPAMRCASCHQDKNLELARVPGAPDWHLAPKSMAWMGRTPTAVCAQIKDPARNGGRTLAKIADHAANDAVVAWGWAPGHGRTPAPGSQAIFGALVAAWIDSGAACPIDEGGAKP